MLEVTLARMRKFCLLLCLFLSLSVSALLGQTADPIVRFNTVLGNIDVQLDPTDAPNTVNNFLTYVYAGSYNSSFIHRSVPGFIIQGGGYTYDSTNGAQTIVANSPVINEYKRSNLRGTIAMAKLSNDPNSATDQWFFNLADNSANLNNQDGGFTAFGSIVNTDGLAVMDAIAALQVINAGSPFDQLPVINYTSGGTVTGNNLVLVNSITLLPTHYGFFDGEAALTNAVYYLAFSNGNYFGYYSYLSDPAYIYHFDLGYEYTFDANDGHRGIYLYDFKSNGFFYSSPTFPFPYLYDFTLNSVVYYYGDPSNPGHYNTNGVRYFYVFSTGQIISK